MPIAFEIQQGLPCVVTNLPNLLHMYISAHLLPNNGLADVDAYHS